MPTRNGQEEGRGTPGRGVDLAWPKYPLICEINVRAWLRDLSARAQRRITLAEVPAPELERLAALGFHAVWLMGVWTTGPRGTTIARDHPDLQAAYREALPDYGPDDCEGSPFAVAAYEVAPQLGGPESLAVLRARLARRGLRLLLDFVSNHTGCDHPWTEEQPELFVQGSEEDLACEPNSFFRTATGRVIAHGRDPYFPAWTDTAQVNYARQVTRDKIRETVLEIAAQCDGVRCDMAMLIFPDVLDRVWGERLGPDPIRTSFWPELIATVVERHPGFLFLAEAYWDTEWRLQQEGFHFTYDKTLYDRLLRNDVQGVRQHLQAEREYQDHCARFVENHDEFRAVKAFGRAGARSAAAATFFTPGLKLFHEGQIEGHSVKLPVQLARRPQETNDLESVSFYEKMLSFLRDPIFQTGIFSQLDVQCAGREDDSNESMLAFFWMTGDGMDRARLGCLIVVNRSGARAYARIPLPAQAVNGDERYVFHDHFAGERYDRDGAKLLKPGLFAALDGHQVHLLEVWRSRPC